MCIRDSHHDFRTHFKGHFAAGRNNLATAEHDERIAAFFPDLLRNVDYAARRYFLAVEPDSLAAATVVETEQHPVPAACVERAREGVAVVVPAARRVLDTGLVDGKRFAFHKTLCRCLFVDCVRRRRIPSRCV